tara:strand:- start:3737 stop:4984 length:1248 start_codon:yes stop_codon:yes gene_type:complete
MFYIRSEIILRNIVITIFSVFNLLLFYKFIDNDYVIGNGVISIITYGSFFPLLIIPNKFFNNRNIFYKIIKISIPIIILESFLGIFQGLYGIFITGIFDLGFGDYVEGTIHPQLRPEKSMSNPIYAIILSTSLIFLYANKHRIKNFGLIFLIGLVAFIFSSVNHLIAFLLLSMVISYLIFKPKIFRYSNKVLKLIQGTLLILFLLFSIKILSITNLAQLGNTASYLIENRYPKTKIIYMFFDNNINTKAFSKYIGLGPGQVISRASFISSGSYFGGPSSNSLEIPFANSSKFFNQHVDPLWKKSLQNTQIGSSTSSQIQSSWGAILTEFGIIIWFLMLIFILKTIIKVKRHIYNREDRYLGFAFSTILLYIFLMGIQQNYWEVSQAIFIPLIILKIIYSFLTIGNPSNILVNDNI